MTIATKYNPLVAWRTLASEVYCAQAISPQIYSIKVVVIDTNEIGFGEVEAGYYFTDYIGTPYLVTSVAHFTGYSNLLVEDSFGTGHCPTSGRMGIVHKSAYKGQSLYLPADSFRHLHPLAAQNNNKYAVSILWGNDPNPLRIPFTATDVPKITQYQADQTIDSIVYNLAEDYGENPKCRLMQDIDGIVLQRTELPYFTYGEGLISSIEFGVISEEITGYIEISR